MSKSYDYLSSPEHQAYLQQKAEERERTKAERQAWFEEAELLPELRCTQGLDGKAGFYYYDHGRALAFHWNGDATEPIQVAQGGDHEPVRWEFSFMLFRPKWIIAGTKTAAMAFQYVCEEWILAREDAR